MGKLIVTEFVTMDGVAQAPGGREEDSDGDFAYGGWQAPLRDEDAARVVYEEASTMDALLLGRRTYEIFAGYWPNASTQSPFTGLLNGVPKHVASRSLVEPLGWTGSTLLSGPLEQAVAAVKERYAEVHVIGSLDLLQSLLRLGLVDRLSLWLHPLVLGSGKRLFGNGTRPTALHLVDSVTYGSGKVHLTYEPAGPPSYGNIDA